ncbi:LysR family transcriptional regulator [Limosilactobacillus fermentum]|uniref:LysR family transcriptional regulator n=1 Tax=Limosilactobacillus fermentum TaxID=1613 RepID=UPI0022E92F79|nr:LysR family transcriptional regulator [Limosilactobacillus fermentum]
MKQINKLEQELGVALFTRTSTGVTLTPAGKGFKGYAEQIVNLVNQALVAGHQFGGQRQVIRLGTSLMHPGAPFMATWNQIKAALPNYQLTVTQLSGEAASSNREYAMLGQECDIMIGTFDQATTRQLVVAVPLGAYHFGIAVTSDHPLAHHSRLALNDLAGQRLLMAPRGISEKNDQLRDAIETAAPDVIIEGTRGRYNLDVFNRAADQNLALLNLTPWQDLHPNLVTVPLDTPLTVNYGALASRQALQPVQDFMNRLRQLI